MLEIIEQPSMIPLGDYMEQPPTIDEVLAYAKTMVESEIRKRAQNLPEEQRREIVQDAYYRCIKKFPEFKVDMGWKSLVFNHCRGAVQDYKKMGKGFAESRWTLKDPTGRKINSRVSLNDREDGTAISVDQVLGRSGVFSEIDLDKIKINWDLVAKMSSQDECLRAFAMTLRGHTLEEIAPVFAVKVSRADQLVQAFINRFDDPEYADCHWFKQCCYALGVSELLGMPEVDESVVVGFSMGWGLVKVDLDDLKPHQAIIERDSQMGFFDE